MSDNPPTTSLMDEIIQLIQEGDHCSICMECHEYGVEELEPDGLIEGGCECGGNLVGLEDFLFHNCG